MAPNVEAFPPSELEDRLQIKANGKRQKPPVELKDCALRELSQYECRMLGPNWDPGSAVECREFVRLFRRCSNGLTVETTSWERLKEV